MTQIPIELMQKLAIFCEQNHMSLAQVGMDDVSMIIIAADHYSPDQAAIVLAHMLLSGIITGHFSSLNREILDDKERKPN